MRAKVQTLDGSASVDLDVDAKSTVAGLKEACRGKWLFPAMLQKLAVGGTVLQDSDVLESLCAAGEPDLVVTFSLSLSVLEDVDDYLRYEAHQALDQATSQLENAFAECAERAVQAVIGCLLDAEAGNRRLAMRILGDVAPPGDTRVVDLACAALDDEEPQVVCAAMEVLAKRAPPSDPAVTDALIACMVSSPLKHGEDVTFAAVRTLGSLARKGDRKSIDALCAGMKDPNSYMRMLVLDIVSVVAEPGDKVAVAAVQACLKDFQGNIRLKALETFAKLSVEADENAVAALIECTRDVNAKLRCRAIIALGKLLAPGANESAISAVCAAVADEEEDVRCVALEVLPEVAAPGDEQALEAVRLRLEPEEDPDADVLEAARDALTAITAQAPFSLLPGS